MSFEQRKSFSEITIKAPVEEHHIDELTMLPNRAWLNGAMDELIQNHPGNFAVLFLDLDGFKGINDTLGHDAGDEKLKEAAHALELFTRESDIIVARPHGDEFIVLLPGVNGDEDLEAARTRLQTAMDDSNIHMSSGGSIHQDGETAQSVLKRADEAMHINKVERLPSLDIKARLAVWAGDLALRVSKIEPRDLPKHIEKLSKEHEKSGNKPLRLRDALRRPKN